MKPAANEFWVVKCTDGSYIIRGSEGHANRLSSARIECYGSNDIPVKARIIEIEDFTGGEDA